MLTFDVVTVSNWFHQFVPSLENPFTTSHDSILFTFCDDHCDPIHEVKSFLSYQPVIVNWVAPIQDHLKMTIREASP